MSTRLAPLVFVFWLLAPCSALAAGFAVGEQGAASLGVAGAATARNDLPETGFYNPAATPSGFSATAGVALIFPTITHFDPGSQNLTKSEPSVAEPPFAQLGWVGAFDRHRFGAVLVGNVPFGAGLHWPPSWNGRFDVTAIELQVFEASASAVYGIALSEDFEVGGGGSIRLLRSTVELERNIDAIATEADVQIGGDASALAGGASLWSRLGVAQVGISYRGPATLDFEGAAHFENVPIELSGAAHDQPVSTTITLPERFAFGGAYDLGFAVASLDLEYYHWARFERFGIDFADDATPDVDEPRNWHDTVTVRLGWEHRLLDKRLAVRGGAAFDPTPSPTNTLSPTLPDASRVLVTAGVGYRFDFGLRVDLALANVALLGATATGEAFPGDYGGGARIVSFSLGYSHE